MHAPVPIMRSSGCDQCLQIRHVNLNPITQIFMYVRQKRDDRKEEDIGSCTLMRIAPEEACSLHRRDYYMTGRDTGVGEAL